MWLAASPFTAPFMLIRMFGFRTYKFRQLTSAEAIIPNLPFFFCAWRSWHHYRGKFHFHRRCPLLTSFFRQAYKASSYLEGLILRGAIEPQPSVRLDRIYEQYGPDAPGDEKKANSPLLRREAVPKIVSLFELPSTAEADLYRALDQTANRLKRTS